eukprot:6208267-Pleurochrysis_carterae.AAC.10
MILAGLFATAGWSVSAYQGLRHSAEESEVGARFRDVRALVNKKLRENATLRSVTIPMVLSNPVHFGGAQKRYLVYGLPLLCRVSTLRTKSEEFALPVCSAVQAQAQNSRSR